MLRGGSQGTQRRHDAAWGPGGAGGLGPGGLGPHSAAEAREAGFFTRSLYSSTENPYEKTDN